MDWVAKMLGLDESFWNEGKVGAGVIQVRFFPFLSPPLPTDPFLEQGSASESALVACVAARERFLRLHPGTPASDLVILATTQTHSLGAKAALILGLGFHAIETKGEDEWALRGETLRSELEELEKKGKKPFILSTSLPFPLWIVGGARPHPDFPCSCHPRLNKYGRD